MSHRGNVPSDVLARERNPGAPIGSSQSINFGDTIHVVGPETGHLHQSRTGFASRLQRGGESRGSRVRLGYQPADPVSDSIIAETIQEQTRRGLTNISTILEADGSLLPKIVSATIVLAEEQGFAGMNQKWC